MLWENDENTSLDERIIQDAISNKKHLEILRIHQWKIPIHTYEVEVTSSTKSKMDILRKVVMHTLANYQTQDLNKLSELLHVDPLFIEDIVNEMLVTKSVERKHDIYHLTSSGISQLEAGTILSEPQTETISFRYSVCNSKTLPLEDKNEFIQEDWDLELYRYIDNEEDLNNTTLSEEKLRQHIQQSGTQFEIGSSEKIISEILPLKLIETNFAKCIEFQLYDIATDKVYMRIWNGATARWDEKLEETINKFESLSIKDKYMNELIEKSPNFYLHIKEMHEALVKAQETNLEYKEEVLRDRKIRDRFIQSFTDTQKKMLIVSPWISREVVDKKMMQLFQNFANEGKVLYISWGYKQEKYNENKLPPDSLISEMQSIKGPDGSPAIFVRWFGNQHNKEIVIDDKILMMGSHNWLSYRGDYNNRGESVYVITNEQEIQNTMSLIEDKFINQLEKELDTIFSEEDSELKDILNWAKELIRLDSDFYRRKDLSDLLVTFLKENELNDYHYQLATLWARNNCEDFGCKEYLHELLEKDEISKAKEYYSLCLDVIPTSQLWDRAYEFREFKNWLLYQQEEKNSNNLEKPKSQMRNKKSKAKNK